MVLCKDDQKKTPLVAILFPELTIIAEMYAPALSPVTAIEFSLPL